MKAVMDYLAGLELDWPYILKLAGVLLVGCIVSFIVSMLVIRALMDYVRRSSFSLFGVYRIILGIMVLGYFIFA